MLLISKMFLGRVLTTCGRDSKKITRNYRASTIAKHQSRARHCFIILQNLKLSLQKTLYKNPQKNQRRKTYQTAHILNFTGTYLRITQLLRLLPRYFLQEVQLVLSLLSSLQKLISSTHLTMSLLFYTPRSTKRSNLHFPRC